MQNSDCEFGNCGNDGTCGGDLASCCSSDPTLPTYDPDSCLNGQGGFEQCAQGRLCSGSVCQYTMGDVASRCNNPGDCFNGLFAASPPHTLHLLDCSSGKCGGLGAMCVADDGVAGSGVAEQSCMSGELQSKRRSLFFFRRES